MSDLTTPMNYMNFAILGIDAKPVEAAASFIYNGYIISMSTIMRNPCIAVFIDADSEVVYEAESVADAIEWVNINGK